MRPVRTILCLVLLLATSWSLAAAYPAAMPAIAADGHAAAATDAHACCHKTAPAKSDDHKNPNCPTKCLMMQCCRMLPTRADDRPVLQLSGDAVIDVQVLPPVRLLSLADPADIFHPPRA